MIWIFYDFVSWFRIFRSFIGLVYSKNECISWIVNGNLTIIIVSLTVMCMYVQKFSPFRYHFISRRCVPFSWDICMLSSCILICVWYTSAISFNPFLMASFNTILCNVEHIKIEHLHALFQFKRQMWDRKSYVTTFLHWTQYALV